MWLNPIGKNNSIPPDYSDCLDQQKMNYNLYNFDEKAFLQDVQCFQEEETNWLSPAVLVLQSKANGIAKWIACIAKHIA